MSRGETRGARELGRSIFLFRRFCRLYLPYLVLPRAINISLSLGISPRCYCECIFYRYRGNEFFLPRVTQSKGGRAIPVSDDPRSSGDRDILQETIVAERFLFNLARLLIFSTLDERFGMSRALGSGSHGNDREWRNFNAFEVRREKEKWINKAEPLRENFAID